MVKIQNLLLKNQNCKASQFEKVCRIIERHILEHTSGEPSGNTIEALFVIKDGIGIEGFTIEIDGIGRYIITGNDELGLFYGVGRFLHEGGYKENKFIPGGFTGRSVPEKTIRGMYIANPGWNYYGLVNMEEIGNYIEDLMLWGCNSIMVVVPGVGQEEATLKAHELIDKWSKRSKDIMTFANELGMTTVALTTSNVSFSSPPEELLADWTSGHDGYTHNLAAHMHIEICPSKPGGLDYILKGQRAALEIYLDSPPDYICLWPYDAGGCTCSGCKPWGGNGYLRVAKATSKLLNEMFPNTRVILSTWLFDDFTTGEWDALESELKDDKSWLDCLMVHFSQEAGLPGCVKKSGRIPGDLPAVDFPEISMFGCVPWGGFGANPLSERLQKMWDMSKEYLEGGYPYSEGIFEDINKVICLQLYWGCSNTSDIVKWYANYEFAPDVADKVSEAIRLIELAASHTRVDEVGRQHIYPDPLVPWIGEQRFMIDNTTGIDKAYEIMMKANEQLSQKVRDSWRWRILYLRTVCDYELFHNDFLSTGRYESALYELTGIYHAERVPYHLAPPTKESIGEARGIFTI